MIKMEVLMDMIRTLFQEKDVATICRERDEQVEKEKTEKYRNEVMNKVREVINGNGLLTDYIRESGAGKPNVWHVTVNLDPEFYVKIHKDIIISFSWMGLKADIDDSDAFEKMIGITIELDDKIQTQPERRVTLVDRGWAWHRLEKSVLEQRIQTVINMHYKRLVKEIDRVMKDNWTKSEWVLYPSGPVSKRVLEKVQDEFNKNGYAITASFVKTGEESEDGRLQLRILAPKAD
jgi:hypothetical protein